MIARTLRFILPALVPSWRFFDVIAPSPRIEFVMFDNQQNTPRIWQEHRPKPNHVSIACTLSRLVYNPHQNEDLFLVSCAERIIENNQIHSLEYIANSIKNTHPNAPHNHMQFRLVFEHRNGDIIEKQTQYTSPVFDMRQAG